MIHRAVTGSVERFLGILIEDCGGDFPFWLAPEQARIIPVSDRHHDYAHRTADALKKAGIRATVDARSESMGKRIRDGELQKVPYLLIAGDREQEAGSVSVRGRHGADEGARPVAELVDDLARLAAG